MNPNRARARMAELKAEVDAKLKAVESGSMSSKAFSGFIAAAEAEQTELADVLAQHAKALGMQSHFPADGSVPHDYASQRPTGVRGKAAPLAIDDAAMHALWEAGRHRTSLSVKAVGDSLVTKTGATLPWAGVSSLLPNQQAGPVIGPVYEDRLLDRLPTMAIEAPTIQYLRHTSTTGSPSVVAEGDIKPSLALSVDTLTCTPSKIAAHVAVSDESLSDYVGWSAYCQAELFRQLVDTENDLLLNSSSGIDGFLHVSGKLTLDASDYTVAFDSLEASVNALRVGSSLATANLLILSPTTWSSIRREKDLYGRYLAAPDPTAAEANSVWGVPVLTTTQLADGTGIMLDTTKFGFVAIREGLNMRTGTADDDFIANIQRYIGEERIGLAIQRPTSVLVVSNLPTTTVPDGS